METYELRYFETPDGPQLLRAKGDREGSVPFGTSYDDGDRIVNLTRRIRNDIFPLLNAIQTITINHYGLEPGSISYSGYSPYEKFNNISLSEFEDFCNNYLFSQPPDYFDIVLVMKITKLDILWDAQFRICVDCVKLQDEDSTEDFPVWYLGFGNLDDLFHETLDENYSAVMISDIVKWALELIQLNYDYTLNRS